MPFTKTIAQSISGVINSYYKITGVNIVPNTLTVSSAVGLTPGLKVLIIQMKGAGINSSNSSSFGDISSIGNAGNYEFNYICGISGNNVLLQYQLLKSYDAAGFVQLIPVPQYTSVTIVDTVKPSPWNSVSGTGGVVVIRASDTIFLNGPVDVSGKGFEGGFLSNYANCVWSTNVTSYVLPVTPADPNTNGARKGEGISDFIVSGEYGRGKQANGGGGGNNHNTGGGGGSNYGVGGNGGNRSNETFFACHGTNPGIGGLSLSAQGYTVANNRIFMGGGGGSGHQNNSVGTPGGNGGGIIILLAKTIVSSGNKLLSNGTAPYNPLCSNPVLAEGDGGGGGGGGGTVLFDVQQVSGTVITEVNGANGSVSGNATNNCTGPGGGGGGGVFWLSNAGVLPAITFISNGGLNGTVSMANSTAACRGLANGASAGTSGAILTGFMPPVATNFVCAPLVANNIAYFIGNPIADATKLAWAVFDTTEIAGFQLERSSDLVTFKAIAFLHNNSSKELQYTDPVKLSGIVYYRLQVQYKNYKKEYAPVISIRTSVSGQFNLINILPNPANDKVRLLVYARQSGNLTMVLYNQQGQVVRKTQQLLLKGYSTIPISSEPIPPGIYHIGCAFDGKKYARTFIVQR